MNLLIHNKDLKLIRPSSRLKEIVDLEQSTEKDSDDITEDDHDANPRDIKEMGANNHRKKSVHCILQPYCFIKVS